MMKDGTIKRTNQQPAPSANGGNPTRAGKRRKRREMSLASGIVAQNKEKKNKIVISTLFLVCHSTWFPHINAIASVT